MPLDLNLMPPTPSNLLSGAPAPVAAPPPTDEETREFGDTDATRRNIYDQVLVAAQGIEPVSNQTHTLRLSKVDWQDPDTFTLRQQKEAILGGRTLGRRLRGTWELVDNETGGVLDRRRQVVATVPHLTPRGTFVHRGNENTLRNQQRLRGGVFTRVRENGEIEAHANILPGKGVSHRYFLDPEKGVFYVRLHNAKLPLMPLLKAMGATPAELREIWGDDLYAANYPKDEGAAIKKYAGHVLTRADQEDEERTTAQKLVDRWTSMELDPEVTGRTLGKPYDRMSKEAILDTTRKLLAISRDEADVDDRDSLAYQHFLGPEDLLAERIAKDHGRLRRQLLWKAARKGNLSGMPSSALRPQVESAILHSGLGQPLEEINPAEIFDKQYSISRLGEGGIPSLDAVPAEARSVQPSHFGFVDPLRTPESFRVGVDVYMTRNARKGKNGRIYTQFKDPRSGKLKWLSPQDVADSVITFPRALARPGKRVIAMKGSKMIWAKKRDVNLVMPNFEDAFSPLGNLVPMKGAVKGQRMAMASRMLTQALPLVEPESPWVQSAMPGTRGGRSYEEEYAKQMGAVHAKRGGRVLGIDDDGMKVRYDDGSEDSIELYHHFPFNRKTYLHQTPLVRPGQRFAPGALLARSNYTDERGATALGRNARVAYVSWQGKNHEDAIVISEGFAKKLASEHMYQNELEVDDRTKIGKKTYVSLFPSRYERKILETLDDRGVVKPGTEVEKGHPLILAARQRELSHNKVHKRKQASHADHSIVWDHNDPGIVTDVVDGKKGPVVLVKSTSPMQKGDKLSGRYGDKGVISAIIPDAQMPQGQDGKPFEVLLNPLGIIGRTNPSQKIELWLGKLAAKQGKPIRVEDWDDSRDYVDWAREQLRKAGLSDTEDIIDPSNDSKIRGIPTGNRFFMKLHHQAEAKEQGRGGGAYTAEDAPAKGGKQGSKRVALLDTNALLSHGAVHNLEDVGAIRGQRNEDYWLQFMMGHNPPMPRVPMAYHKFVEQLRASGINVVREGTQTNIMALTDKDVDELAGDRNLMKNDGVDWGRGLRPIRGGLFDKKLTGGHSGRRWSAIRLTEPMPNPVMEEPIRRVLGLTKAKFEAVISGDHELPKFGIGAQAIGKALQALNLDKELSMARAQVSQGSKTERDQAVRKLDYLKRAKKLGIHPGDWVLKRAPVLPPAFRPVSMMDNDLPMISDANYLYKELMEANDNLAAMKKELGDEGAGPERLAVYHAFKAVTGLGDPISQKSREKNVRGILKSVFGSSPKFGTVQRKLISTTVDNVGRSVITPNPDFDMDTVGLPEDAAFDIYGKFIARRMRRQGVPLTRALQQIKDRTPLARETLVEEMDERPVFINRAPVLHKFGILAFRPKLVKGSTMQVSPLIVKGFNADFDGDQMNFHVPTDAAAVKEAYERMLPSANLLSPADFKSPVHAPGQEFVGGLYHATKSRSKQSVRKFHTLADARAAYAAGKLSLDDQVQILDQ